MVIDPGAVKDAPGLIAYLKQRNKALTCSLLTHGHSDHAGATAPLKEAFPDSKIVSGHEEAMTGTGENHELIPTGKVLSRAVKPMFVHSQFPPFVSDVTISRESQDLGATCAFPVTAKTTPGHTVGSVSYVVGPYVVVGDLIQGGWLNGAIQSRQPRTSFFHGDPTQNFKQLEALLTQGGREYLPGHGAILNQKQVEQYIRQSQQRDLQDFGSTPNNRH